MLNALLLAAVVSAEPAPTASPLKTIIRIQTSPLCTTIRQNVLNVMNGLQANDGIVNASKPVLLRMGKEFEPVGVAGPIFDNAGNHLAGDASVPGGTHDTNPALVLDNQRLKQFVSELQHNLAIVESALADTTKFPAAASPDDDKQTQLIRAQLQAIADQQKRNLGILAGLTDTFSMQDLIAKGDGTQGVLNSPQDYVPRFATPSPLTLSHDDQDVSLQDPISGSTRQNTDTPKDPTVNKDPAVSQPGTDLSNNPMARFYLGVSAIQHQTFVAEGNLGQTLKDLAASCEP
jgi:hypothetical protein